MDAIVLPGVGNFKEAMKNLKALKQNILEAAESGVPLLGICLGMQLFFEESEESLGRGLGILRGKVLKLPEQVKKPHMGWNTLAISKPNEILDGVGDDEYFYFVHSYYADPSMKEVIVAETEYGIRFASVLAENNVYGVQFHPEKSGRSGERVIRNFASIVKR